MDVGHKYPEIKKYVNDKSVHKYIAVCKKEKRKREELYPKCVEIFDFELQRIEWVDSCFAETAYWMLKESHVSQLQNFYCQYNRSVRKTAFFAKWIRDEYDIYKSREE